MPNEDQRCLAHDVDTSDVAAMLQAARRKLSADAASIDNDLVDALRVVLPQPDKQMQLLAMLQMVDQSLSSANVPYWITGGTLLGAIRHGGFIPHDDDVDLEIMSSDWPRAAEALGAVGRSFRGIGQWMDSGVHEGRIFFWGDDRRFTTSIDIFFREDTLEELDEFPSHDEVFPLQRVPFHDILVSAPTHAASFLARCYGTSWAEEAVVWGHTARGRRLLRCPLCSYTAAAAAAGYRAPEILPRADESLALVGLTCPGELHEELWSGFGWGSPCPLECDGVDKEDSNVLDLLNLQVQRFPLDAAMFCTLSPDRLQQISQVTGTSLDVETNSTANSKNMLRAVGSSEELEHLHQILKETFAAPIHIL